MAKKRFGQNFLSNKKYLKQMAEILADIPKDAVVVEIGPGKGALTEYLIELGNPLICVEIDKDFYQRLNERFGEYSNFTLVEGDIRNFSIPEESDKVVVVGNVPYYISFEIIEFVVRNRNKVIEAYFTFQKEFVQKLAAKLNTKTYGFLTCFIAMFYDVKQCFKIPASAFNPRPKIDSAFVRLSLKDKQLLDDPDLSTLKSFLRGIFSQRRKKISNILKSKYPTLTDSKFTLDIDLSKRPESIDCQQLAALFSSLP